MTDNEILENINYGLHTLIGSLILQVAQDLFVQWLFWNFSNELCNLRKAKDGVLDKQGPQLQSISDKKELEWLFDEENEAIKRKTREAS